MANNQQYRFSNSQGGFVSFDSEGYIIEAKGFGSLMWSSSSINIDQELVGKSVDELAEMLEKNGANSEVYTAFELKVHLPLLKEMLKNKGI